MVCFEQDAQMHSYVESIYLLVNIRSIAWSQLCGTIFNCRFHHKRNIHDLHDLMMQHIPRPRFTNFIILSCLIENLMVCKICASQTTPAVWYLNLSSLTLTLLVNFDKFTAYTTIKCFPICI